MNRCFLWRVGAFLLISFAFLSVSSATLWGQSQCNGLNITLIQASSTPDQCCFTVKYDKTATAPAVSQIKLRTTPPTILSSVGAAGYTAMNIGSGVFESTTFSKGGVNLGNGSQIEVGTICVRKPQSFDYVYVDFMDVNGFVVCSQPVQTFSNCSALPVAGCPQIDNLKILCIPGTNPKEYTATFDLYTPSGYAGQTVNFIAASPAGSVVTPTSAVLTTTGVLPMSLTLKPNQTTPPASMLVSVVVPANQSAGTPGCAFRFTFNLPDCNTPLPTPCVPPTFSVINTFGYADNSSIQVAGGVSNPPGQKLKSVTMTILNPQIKQGPCGTGTVSNRPWQNVGALFHACKATNYSLPGSCSPTGFGPANPGTTTTSSGNQVTITYNPPIDPAFGGQVSDYVQTMSFPPPPMLAYPGVSAQAVQQYVNNNCRDSIRFNVLWTVTDEYGCVYTQTVPVKFARTMSTMPLGWNFNQWGTGYYPVTETKGGEIQSAVGEPGVYFTLSSTTEGQLVFNFPDDVFQDIEVSKGFNIQPTGDVRIASISDETGAPLNVQDGAYFADSTDAFTFRDSPTRTYEVRLENPTGADKFEADVALLWRRKGINVDGYLVETDPIRVIGRLSSAMGGDKITGDKETPIPTGVRTYQLSLENNNNSGEPVSSVRFIPQNNTRIIAFGPLSSDTNIRDHIFDVVEDGALRAGNQYELQFRRSGRFNGTEQKGASVQGYEGDGLPVGTSIKPIYFTIAGTTGDDAEIGFETMNFKGDVLSQGSVVLTNPVSSIEIDVPDGGTEAIGVIPNPVASAASVNFRLDRSHSGVSLTLIDEQGRTVRVIADNEPMAEGNHTLYLETDGLSGGVYILRMETRDGIIRTARIVLRR